MSRPLPRDAVEVMPNLAPTQAGSDGHVGLSTTQATERLQQEGSNELPGGQRRSGWAIAVETLRESMFLLLLAAGTLYAVFGDLQEGLSLFGVVLVTLALTLYQEGKTERAIEALRDLTSPRAFKRGSTEVFALMPMPF